MADRPENSNSEVLNPGDRLKALCLGHDITYDELSEAIGFSRNQIAMTAIGHRKMSKNLKARLTEYFHLNAKYFDDDSMITENPELLHYYLKELIEMLPEKYENRLLMVAISMVFEYMPQDLAHTAVGDALRRARETAEKDKKNEL